MSASFKQQAVSASFKQQAVPYSWTLFENNLTGHLSKNSQRAYLHSAFYLQHLEYFQVWATNTKEYMLQQLTSSEETNLSYIFS